MIYPNLFASYHPLKGSDWLRTISLEDLQAFVHIGLQESGHGRKGGKELYNQRGSSYMAQIGQRGAFMTNLKKWIAKRIEEETLKELSL